MRDAERVAPFVRMALECVHRAYPNQIAHVMVGDDDARPPRALTPVFYGCYDWHSAVHGHWLLARASRCFPGAAFTSDARDRLARSLRPEAVVAEVAYLARRPGFERPYGLAWLATLQAELVEAASDASDGGGLRDEAAAHAEVLAPLTAQALAHLGAWLPKLSHPTRVGTHAQTAFSLGLLLDACRAIAAAPAGPSRGSGNPLAAAAAAIASLVHDRARAFFGADHDYPLHLEPGGEDFLSPSLGAADLMRRVLAPAELSTWLDRTLGAALDGDTFERALAPVRVTDPTDGRLAHLDGLNLSRAWMLEGVADALAEDDPRRARLTALAARHAELALAAIDGAHYAGSHWLGTFACYLVTRRGRGAPRP
ncbi:MAG: DUF2891 domain-containing protein [Myxococcales bacterium]|nr:DUF2891 domain-containing protein [Myxococcales bacterium]